MSVREYIGARYVPMFAEPLEWDSTKTYEPLTIVYYQGNSYTSRQYVPSGIVISNESYWALTGNYNAQIEQYRTEVATIQNNISDISDDIDDITSDISDISDIMPSSAFSSQNTIKNYIDGKTPPLNPDNFTGATDYAKLQACIDYAIANEMPTIIIGRKYDISGHALDVTKGTTYLDDNTITRRKNLTFIGMNGGMIVKEDSGFMFTATSLSGDFCFINMHFRGGGKNTSSVFNSNLIIRVKTFGCFYEYLKYCFDGTYNVASLPDSNYMVMQSINTFGDTAYNCKAYCIIRKLWDCTFNAATIETCDNGFLFDETYDALQATDLAIANCCIESTEGAIRFNQTTTSILVALKIQDCYFESNGGSDIYINARYTYNINISNNHFENGSENVKNISIYQRDDNGYIIGGNDFSLGSNTNSVGIYFLDDTNRVVYGQPNTFRGNGKLSNHVFRVYTTDRMKYAKQNETVTVGLSLYSAYATNSGTRLTFSIPVGKQIDTGMTPSFSFNRMTVIGNGVNRTYNFADVTIVSDTHYYNGVFYIVLDLNTAVTNEMSYTVRPIDMVITFSVN